MLSQGTFTLNSDNEDLFLKRDIMNTTEAVVDFFDDGYIEFDVLDFAAHIELESAVTRAQQLLTFNIPFPNITLTPFQVRHLSQECSHALTSRLDPGGCLCRSHFQPQSGCWS